MKQVIHEEFGDPAQVLRCVETEDPVLGASDVRVEVLRAPINPSDLIQIAGQYGVRPDLPAVPGNEGLGRVIDANGTELKEGQLVLLPAGSGTWATEIVAGAGNFVPLPDGDLDQLAMLAINPATAYLLLDDFADLATGDWIIQSAANSAVGAYVIQLAHARGLKVACVVRRQSAVAGLKEMGADAVLVDGDTLPRDVAQATDGAPISLALDAVAGETMARLAATLAPGGTLVSYGAMSMAPAPLDAKVLIFSGITLRGFWLAQWFEDSTPERRSKVYGDLTALVASGKLSAPVDRHFALEDIAEAAAYTAAGERSGKVLLAPNGT